MCPLIVIIIGMFITAFIIVININAIVIYNELYYHYLLTSPPPSHFVFLFLYLFFPFIKKEKFGRGNQPSYFCVRYPSKWREMLEIVASSAEILKYFSCVYQDYVARRRRNNGVSLYK